MIRVQDTGPGMPAKALENLFRPFRGGMRRGGAGLGLAIAAELVRAHGGQLDLISSTTVGTEFSIRLPTAPHGSD
jgi:signal transduction histidine kinase